MIGGVTIDELRWYVVLAETENVTAAASRLHVTQPTLSRALGRLELELGTPLFDRVGRRLRLNRYGAILLAHARRSLDELNAASDRIASLVDPEHGTIRLAFLHSVASWLVPDLLRRYREQVPGVQFELKEAPGHEVLGAVVTGRADLGVVSSRAESSELGWHTLQRERLCLAVPAGHRLARRRETRLAEAARERFVMPRSEIGLREISDELCARSGFAPHVAVETTEISTMEGLVTAGLGVAIVPSPRPDRAEPGVVYIPLTGADAYREIGLIWVPDRAQPAVAARFAEFVRSTRSPAPA